MHDSIIRPELLALGLVKEIPINKLLKIEKVATYLEVKGRQPNTVDSFRRHINVLARHADIDNPQEVELANSLAADFTYQLTTPDGTMIFKKAK